MDRIIVDHSIRTILNAARRRFEAAAAISHAAVACAAAGQTAKAATIANGMDDDLDEADQLLNAMAAISRLTKEGRDR
ncbi:hypothetical protein [Bauldia litoralis]|uniref:hypothetical protein n=1 Tax=Bauldia litoralis TaxID=665467 RepID=UPI00326799FA